MIQPLISTVVCTFNRASLLRNVLIDLGAQNLDRDQYEVLVVDNNSEDDTRAVADEFERQYPNVRYVHEPEQGLAHARNRGWREAKGDYVGYTDDDCRMPPQWLSVAAEIIRARRPALFGGPYYACYNTPKPKWFKDEYESHVQGDIARFFSKEECLDGGNMFLRRDLLERLNGFDASLGMSGTKLAYGEETALQLRVRAEMPSAEVYYDPRLYLRHLVRPEKMRLGWVLRHRWVAGRSATRALGPDAQRTRREIRRMMIELICTMGRELVRIRRRDYRRYPHYQNYVYERISPHVVRLGQLWEARTHAAT